MKSLAYHRLVALLIILAIEELFLILSFDWYLSVFIALWCGAIIHLILIHIDGNSK